MIEPQVALDKLGALGDARDIALFLQAEGITGTHLATSCPVANYVWRETGVSISVCSNFWARDEAGRTYDQETVPPAVGKFIRSYDLLGFPELDEGII